MVLLVLLIATPAISTVAAVVLVRAARQHPPIRFLTERAAVAVVVTVAAWIIGALSVNRVLRIFEFGPPGSTLLVLVALLLFSAPGPVFLVLYARGYLRDDQ